MVKAMQSYTIIQNQAWSNQRCECKYISMQLVCSYDITYLAKQMRQNIRDKAFKAKHMSQQMRLDTWDKT